MNNAVVCEAIGTIDNLLTPIQIASVVVAKTQLYDLLYGKVEGFNWLMSAMSAIQNPTKVDEFNAEQGAFVAMTNTVERDLPSAKPDLDRVVRANNVALKETNGLFLDRLHIGYDGQCAVQLFAPLQPGKTERPLPAYP